MHIRNESGKLVRAEELSVVSAFKQHEATFLKFGNEISENDSAKDYLFLIFPNQSIDIKVLCLFLFVRLSSLFFLVFFRSGILSQFAQFKIG